MHRFAFCALAALSGSLGCAATNGSIGPKGFDQHQYSYHVDYQDPGNQSFLGSDWRIDNFTYSEAQHEWQPKDSDQYMATRELDEDNDGEIGPREKSKEPIYDLRLANVHDDGFIWSKAHPMTFEDSRRNLDVIIANYADSLAGTGAYDQGSIFSLQHTRARQFTTFVVGQAAASVAGIEGLTATVELAETARWQVDSNFRSAKVRICVAKLPYSAPVPVNLDGSKPASSKWPVVDCAKISGAGALQGETRVSASAHKCVERLGLLVVGYANDAAHFDQHLPDYETFVSKLSRLPVDVPEEPALGHTPHGVSE